MQTLSADITTKTMTSEPMLSQSERVQGFGWDVASCGLLKKEHVLLFFNVFYSSFCFCDADLRGLCCRPASLTSYSHLNFVSL